MGRMLKEVGQVTRGLIRTPVFALATVVLIGLGAGTVTAVWTIVDDVLLAPLPWPAEDRLVHLSNGSHNGPTLDRIPEVSAFEAWTAAATSTVTLVRDDGTPLSLELTETTPSYFTLFAARPHLGRLLTDADRDDRSIVVLSWTAWRDIWGKDLGVVGSVIRVDGEPRQVVGVLAEDFQAPSTPGGADADLFTPLWWSDPALLSPGSYRHQVAARLHPGATLEQAQLQIDEAMAAVARSFPDHYTEGPEEKPLVLLREEAVREVSTGLYMLLAAVGLLMLVACANVAHLFMARALGRDREIAIRRAMGAGTRDIVTRLAAEAVVVGVVGGGVALLLAWTGLTAFGHWTVQLPRGTEISLDVGIFAIAIGLAGLTALVFGVGPVLRLIGRDVQDTLRGGGHGITGGRGVRTVRSGLIVAEVAISLVLVSGAGLLMRSFLSVTARDPGIEAAGVHTLELSPTGIEEPEEYVRRMDAVRASLATVSGVRSVSWGVTAPFQFTGGNNCCWSGRIAEADPPIRLRMHPVGAEWWATVGTEMVAGAPWAPGSYRPGDADPPIVISEQLAIRLYGSADAAVGRRAEDILGGAMIAGVAEPTLHYGLDQSHEFAVFLPAERLTFAIPLASFLIRAPEPGDDFARAVRDAVWAVEPTLPVPALGSLEGAITASSGARRLGSLLFSVFGGIALLLAAAGLSGTLLYAVSRQRRELGIRMALGAGRKQVQGRVVARGMVLATVGVAVGVLGSWYLSRFLESWLYQV